jgi:peptide/nickel transport system substrate-binding protein
MSLKSNRRRLVGAAMLGLGLALGAAGAHAEDAKGGGTLVYANISGPGTLDPQMAASLVELEVIHHMYEGLVTIDKNYQTKLLLAESVEPSEDSKTYTFKLRKGVKFHNGQELTSADVKATFERYARVSPNKSALADVESYETPDDYTFVVHLKKPNAVFVDVLKTPVYPFVIQPNDQHDKEPRSIDDVGSGPYKLGEWVKDGHLTLDRFDGYTVDPGEEGADGFAGAREAILEHIRYNFVPEANARLAALQTGEADVISNVPADLVPRLKDKPDAKVFQVYPYCQQYFIVNTQEGLTKNEKIRQAIRAAVDVDQIIAVAGGVDKKSPTMDYEGSPYFAAKEMAKYYDEGDPEKAKKLLEEAGYKGEALVLQTNSNYAYMRDAILVLSEQLKSAGVNVKVDVTDWTTNASNLQKGTGGWNVSTTSFCSNALLGPQQWQTMIYNFPHVENDKVLDEAYEKFYASSDLKDRVAAWKTIEDRVLDQAYMIKVSDRVGFGAYNPQKVEGFEPYYVNRFWGVSLKQQ